MVGLYTGSMVGYFRETGSMVGKQGVWKRNWEYGRETGSMVGKQGVSPAESFQHFQDLTQLRQN